MDALECRLVAQECVDHTVFEGGIHIRIPVKIQVLAVREILKAHLLQICPGQNTDLFPVIIPVAHLGGSFARIAPLPDREGKCGNSDRHDKEHGDNDPIDCLRLFCY